MSGTIHHSGVIERISPGIVFVRIIQRSACSGCHAQAICSASEQKEKIIEVQDRSGQFSVNDQVELIGESRLGMEAVVLAFVIPLVIVVVTVAIGFSLNWEESLSGLIGLLLLVPYYGLLYLLRDRLKRRFVFTLRKLNS